MKWESMKRYVEWDVKSWSRALRFWEKAGVSFEGKRVLEIGGRNGGLSLWAAKKGAAEVICSDLNGPTEKARALHQQNLPNKAGGSTCVQYSAIDATDIPYEEAFDIVLFKSVLGGIGFNGRRDLQERAMEQMYACLKPGGLLLFAENLTASPLHMLLRRKLQAWGNSWRYVTVEELDAMTAHFARVRRGTWGFFSAFGPWEWARNALYYIDALLCRALPKRWRYIAYYVCEK